MEGIMRFITNVITFLVYILFILMGLAILGGGIIMSLDWYSIGEAPFTYDGDLVGIIVVILMGLFWTTVMLVLFIKTMKRFLNIKK